MQKYAISLFESFCPRITSDTLYSNTNGINLHPYRMHNNICFDQCALFSFKISVYFILNYNTLYILHSQVSTSTVPNIIKYAKFSPLTYRPYIV